MTTVHFKLVAYISVFTIFRIFLLITTVSVTRIGEVEPEL